MKTSKSTLTVARLALEAAKTALPDHAHRKSPRKFTQPQLLACLIIREFKKLDYRGLQVFLAEWSELRQALELKTVPHFTTLHQAAGRLVRKPEFQRVMASILSRCRDAKLLKPTTKMAAVDSTG